MRCSAAADVGQPAGRDDVIGAAVELEGDLREGRGAGVAQEPRGEQVRLGGAGDEARQGVIVDRPRQPLEDRNALGDFGPLEVDGRGLGNARVAFLETIQEDVRHRRRPADRRQHLDIACGLDQLVVERLEARHHRKVFRAHELSSARRPGASPTTP